MKERLVYIFSAVFGLSIGFFLIFSVLLPVFVRKNADWLAGQNGKSIWISLALILFAIITVLFFLALYRIFSIIKEAWMKAIAAGLMAVILIAEIAIIVLFKGIYPPAVDGGHIYSDALYLLGHGHLRQNAYYLQVYPNNIAITVVRYWLYRYAAFGNPAAFMPVDKMAAALFLNIGIYFSWKLIVRLFNIKMANVFLVMTLTCLPLFLYIVYFYSDTVVIFFPPLLVYLWYLYDRTKKPLYIILMGLALAIGCQIREDLILFLPAMIIYMFFVLRPKKVLINAGIVAVLLLAVNFSAQSYYQHLGFKQNDAVRMPTSHWMMLGLSPTGGYNQHDLEWTLGQPTQWQKKQADFRQISERIKEKKISGLARLWAVKAVRTFADGSRGYYWYTKNAAHYSAAYEYIFGLQKALMLFIIQVFHIANLFLLMLSSIRFFRTKKYDVNLLMQICLFGSFLFFIFLWEAEPRYSLLFTPFMIMGAVYGLEELNRLFDRSARPVFAGLSFPALSRLLLAAGLLAAVLACAFINFKPLTQNNEVRKAYDVNQIQVRGKTYAVVDAHHNVEQTFQADKPFTRVSVGTAASRGQADYRLSVMRKGKTAIAEVPFHSNKKRVNGFMIFSFKKPIAGDGRDYRLLIRQLTGSGDSKLLLAMNGKGVYEPRDMYPDGHLLQNGRPIKDADLTFTVYKKEFRPYLSENMYGALFLAAIMMIMVYVFSIMKGNFSEEKNARKRAGRRVMPEQ